MKLSIVLFIIWNVTTVSNVFGYSVPEPTIEILNPQGLRIYIPHEKGIVLVAFHLNIDKPIALNLLGDYSADITQPSNDRWLFQISNIFIEPGSKINYWMHVQYGSYAYRKLGSQVAGRATVDISEPESITTNSSFSSGEKLPSDCEKSVTTVGRHPVCKGQLVFEDHFDRLNWTMWKREVRIPIDSDDSEFVSFQSRSENSYVSNGELHIIPNLLSETPGFNGSLIRTGQLDLRAECTAIVDMSKECQRIAQFFQILPPVVTARINTKDFFTFRFGRVEVRAKLPKGDWLFPLILLEPVESYYGFTEHSSGQMRVAFIRGNEILESKTGEDLSGKRIMGGVVLSSGEELRDTWLKSSLRSSHMGDDYHNYTLIWEEDHIALQVDGNEYGFIRGGFSKLTRTHNLPHASLWSNRHKMAPFDREFFLTLGVGAGGHSDFPGGVLNGPRKTFKSWSNHHPKAELRFWNDRENWLKTWSGDEAGLHVDYVKVYAL
ncbi:gram-negative bacteria-binding protein 1-like [Episyrphus balteatus]|uniref:gram-negative bacteria-binding protein 1-like n=1 Tax=Episyrphus balteatus TaxID=286459 RepID=UPI002485AD2A|nr:gram-negative bacteria-binding protein 1-like [Episyrphus balteatus]